MPRKPRPNRGGRPPTRSAPSVVVSARLEPDEDARLRRWAKRQELSRAAAARQAILRGIAD